MLKSSQQGFGGETLALEVMADDRGARVTQAHLLEAFADLRAGAGELTRSLLGDGSG